MDFPRSSGLLLHITSLPNSYGIGDLGPNAHRFVDFLADTEQRFWQVLPLVPVGYGYSPYASPSTFAGNPLFINPDFLADDGLLDRTDLAEPPAFNPHRVDWEQVRPYKRHLLERAFARFEADAGADEQAALNQFAEANADWLPDYALFQVLKEAHEDASWVDWPGPLARREPDALAEAHDTFAREVRMRTFWQFLFDRQWQNLHAHCRQKNIEVFGDLPIYVAHDSADVWAHPELFYLHDDGGPIVISGVPPDYFSATGQRWGNPLYRWDVMRADSFAWWTRRFERILGRVDWIRLDHFRAFEAYWEIPAEAETAIDGRWVEGPGPALFEAVEARLGRLPLVAENLGVITDGVTELMDRFGFPGMAVLQFAFGGTTDEAFLPHNYQHRLVAYTGTHDNDTLAGWWRSENGTMDAEAAARTRAYARLYLNLAPEDDASMHWACIRALMASAAGLVVIPMQDLLGLGSEARMNVPGEGAGNWGWRLHPDALTSEVAFRLRALTRIYGRSEHITPPV